MDLALEPEATAPGDDEERLVLVRMGVEGRPLTRIDERLERGQPPVGVGAIDGSEISPPIGLESVAGRPGWSAFEAMKHPSADVVAAAPFAACGGAT